MAGFDDAMKNAVPGGNLATPIAVAVGALILGKLFGGSSAPASPPAVPIPPPGQPVPTNAPAGSILGGLTDLIGKLSAGRRRRRRSIPGSATGRTSRFNPDSSVRRSARMCLPNCRSAPA